ncbi:MAG: hypothetical protein VB118_08260 [Oscillospiraceae bacterium]|nr:hypothetical protein [Oscillospiraceae bacterium]
MKKIIMIVIFASMFTFLFGCNQSSVNTDSVLPAAYTQVQKTAVLDKLTSSIIFSTPGSQFYCDGSKIAYYKGSSICLFDTSKSEEYIVLNGEDENRWLCVNNFNHGYIRFYEGIVFDTLNMKLLPKDSVISRYSYNNDTVYASTTGESKIGDDGIIQFNSNKMVEDIPDTKADINREVNTCYDFLCFIKNKAYYLKNYIDGSKDSGLYYYDLESGVEKLLVSNKPNSEIKYSEVLRPLGNDYLALFQETCDNNLLSLYIYTPDGDLLGKVEDFSFSLHDTNFVVNQNYYGNGQFIFATIKEAAIYRYDIPTKTVTKLGAEPKSEVRYLSACGDLIIYGTLNDDGCYLSLYAYRESDGSTVLICDEVLPGDTSTCPDTGSVVYSSPDGNIYVASVK